MIMTNAITHGNAVQGLVTGGRPTYFSVGDAIQHLSSLGKVTAEDPLDVELICQNLDISQSPLAFYLRRLVREPQLEAMVIIKGMSICFLGRGNEVLLMDSHLQFGALIGKQTTGYWAIFKYTQVAGESYSWHVFCHFCNLYLKFLFTAHWFRRPWVKQSRYFTINKTKI